MRTHRPLALTTATPSSSTGPIRFFATGTGSCNGTDVGGIAGANAHCQC